MVHVTPRILQSAAAQAAGGSSLRLHLHMAPTAGTPYEVTERWARYVGRTGGLVSHMHLDSERDVDCIFPLSQLR